METAKDIILILVAVLLPSLIWKYLIKRTELIAEKAVEKSLKKFQSELDKELVKFQTKHQNQIDAVQDCYQRFQELHSFIDFVINGEKYTVPMKPEEEVQYLAKYRLEFKRSYKKNRILLPEKLNDKIELLFPEVDIFLQDYMDGLMPTITPDEDIPNEEKSDVVLAGIWPVGKLEPTLEKMEEISKEIESEFRRIYGTDK